MACAVPARADEPLALKVLYAGNTGSDREQDFVAFLREHFSEVGKADYEKFTEDKAKGYDVVIFDWTSIYPRDKDGKIKKGSGEIVMPTPPTVSPEYRRSSILIGAAGGCLATSLRLKIDWR
jgi:hypothetical protein